MTEAANDGESLAEIIVHYNERAAVAKSKVSHLEISLSQLEIWGPPILAPQQQQMAHYTPEVAYFMPDPETMQMPSTMPVPPPKTVQSPQTPKQWTVHPT